jgi:hypothetical protein
MYITRPELLMEEFPDRQKELQNIAMLGVE